MIKIYDLRCKRDMEDASKVGIMYTALQDHGYTVYNCAIMLRGAGHKQKHIVSACLMNPDIPLGNIIHDLITAGISEKAIVQRVSQLYVSSNALKTALEHSTLTREESARITNAVLKMRKDKPAGLVYPE